MHLRIATEADIPRMLAIRLEVKENILRTVLTQEELSQAMRKSCRAWVAEIQQEIVGFSIVNYKKHSVWGLFVANDFQGQGIGRMLLTQAVNWLWEQRGGILRRQVRKIWLETKQGSKAEAFYQHLGWKRGEIRPFNEVRYWLFRKT